MSNLGYVSRILLQQNSINNLSRVKPVVFEPVVFAPTLISFRGLKIKGAGAKGGGGAAGKKGAAMVKPKLEVEEDAHKEKIFSLLNSVPSKNLFIVLFVLLFNLIKEETSYLVGKLCVWVEL